MAAGAIWHIAANPVRLPCGCADWQQFERGEWRPKSWRCHQHSPRTPQCGHPVEYCSCGQHWRHVATREQECP